MKIKISSDSTCELPPELLEKYGIGIVPLTIIIDGKERKDGIDIHPKDIFDWVDSGGEMCKTTAPSPAEYEEIFRAHLRDHDAVIHINIGSGFSASWQDAKLAAEQCENVYAFDSENLSTGQGHLVLEAAKLCLSLGLDVNASNSMGVTPLLGAANRGFNDMVRLLAAHGADLEARDAVGRSAMDWAEGVFLAAVGAEAKPETIALLNELLGEQGLTYE